jgi:hypothetical protein
MRTASLAAVRGLALLLCAGLHGVHGWPQVRSENPTLIKKNVLCHKFASGATTLLSNLDARHVIGCRSTQQTRVKHVEDVWG